MFDHTFKFASLDSKQPRTARKVHIKRLYDIMQLCIQRDDIPRARRAWSILIRCKEIDWKAMWLTAVHLLNDAGQSQYGNGDPRTIEFLREIMLQIPDEVTHGECPQLVS
jgi:RNA polymerase I-specific transcription initiation factor RRN11